MPKEDQDRLKDGKLVKTANITQTGEAFVEDLIKQQFEDQKQRANKAKLYSGGFMSTAESLRQGVTLTEI